MVKMTRIDDNNKGYKEDEKDKDDKYDEDNRNDKDNKGAKKEEEFLCKNAKITKYTKFGEARPMGTS